MTARAKAEEQLLGVFESYRSRYNHTYAFYVQQERVVKFNTTWCRQPTPHEPLPDVRVNIEFTLRYHRKDTGFNEPEITFRIEHEQFVHRVQSYHNIDHHILRMIKFKTQFFKRVALPLSQPHFFESRLKYDELDFSKDVAEPGLEANLANPNDLEHIKAEEIEKYIIRLFRKADIDNSGTLDKGEMRKLLIGSRFNINHEDLEELWQKGEEGMMNFDEFVPLVVDLLQAQQAFRVASANQKAEEAAAKAAIGKRLREVGVGAGLNLRLADGLKMLDPNEMGVVDVEHLRDVLLGIIELSDSEATIVLGKVPLDEDGMCVYEDLVDEIESLLRTGLFEVQWAAKRSDVEEYISQQLADAGQVTVNSGIEEVEDEVAVRALENLKRIKLSRMQIYTIMAGDRSQRDVQHSMHVDVQRFSRVVANVLYALFDVKSLKEKDNVMSRATIAPAEIMDESHKDMIKDQLTRRFAEFDADDDGLLDRGEFHKLVADLSLIVSEAEVEALRQEAMAKGEDVLSVAKFVPFAQDVLLPLAREDALQANKIREANTPAAVDGAS